MFILPTLNINRNGKGLDVAKENAISKFNLDSETAF